MEGYSSAISLRGIADDETVGPMRSLFETVFRPQPFQPVCANLIVETGHFPSWPLIEIRRPCNSSSQTFSTVPAFPSVRTTALPTSSDRASSSAPRIVNAWSFAVGMVASEIRPCEGRGSRRRRLRTWFPHSRSDTGPVIKSSNGFLVCAAAIDRPTTPEEITIGIDVGYATCVFANPGDAPRPIGKASPSAKRPRIAVGPDVARSAPVLPCLEREIIKRAEVAHLKTPLLRGFLQA
jgi:hypothetical protein